MSSFREIPTTLFLSLCFTITLAHAQKAGAQQASPIVVHPIQLGPWPKSIEPFASVPPDITLVPHGECARHGQIWVRTQNRVSYGYGLWVAGKVDGPQPDFPLTRDLLPSKDHIEIWLATSREVALPEIGWTSYGQQETLPRGAESCEDWVKSDEFARGGGVDAVKNCQAWAASQVRYREYFKRLFVRQWLVEPNQQIEAFATPASEHISDWYLDNHYAVRSLEFMKPQGTLQISVFPEPSGYSFAVFIPLESFPPLPSLEIRGLYVLVDVFNAAPAGKKMGVYSTSSPVRVWGKPGTFNALRLDPPFSFPLTPCKFPFAESGNEGGGHLTWVLPNLRYSPDALSDTFVVVAQNNFEWGGWEPSRLSPWINRSHNFSCYFSLGAGKDNGVWVCGPNLTIAKAGKSESFAEVISEEGLEYKQMPDGHLLIKVGPEVGAVGSSHGAGGADPKTHLRIFDLSKDLQLHTALALGDIIDGISLLSQDFIISPDWSQITEYDLRGPYESRSWSSITWCLHANRGSGCNYEKCGEKENVQPPNPPVLKHLRQGYEEPPSMQVQPSTSER